MKTDEAGNTSISIYKDDLLTAKTYDAGKRILEVRFTNFDEKMSLILLDLLIDQGFTNKRFMDAVRFLNINHKYPTMTPADVLGFDKALNLRTYKQVAEEQKTFGNSIWSYYNKVDIKGICYYANIRDLETLGITLPEYKPKPATAKTRHYNPVQNDKFAPLSKDYSFITGYNDMVEETGVGEKIPVNN